jgi:hypothetical protein
MSIKVPDQPPYVDALTDISVNHNELHPFAERLSSRADATESLWKIRNWVISSFGGPRPWEIALSYLPKRVLDIGALLNPTVPCLKEFPNPTQGRYACLSHCWSESEPLATTLVTMQYMKDGIPTTDLSPTLQDAIKLTRYMGVQYLWIDSICIIQDSKADWEEESAKMASYYGDSLFTITGAREKSKGLFGEREFYGPYCKLDIMSEDYRPQSIYFLPHPHVPVRAQGNAFLSPSKIYSRGWTLQEDLLSPRVISFEETQTYFRTPMGEWYECGTVKPPCKMHDQSFDRWLSIVEDYSRRYLTDEDDKLPALSGLAADYQRKWNDRYLAGVWQRQLWKQLQWYAVPSNYRIPRRPSKYRAPSWSWASIDGHINFEPIGYPSKSLFDVSWAEVIAAGIDLRGRVSDGALQVTGYLVECFHGAFDMENDIDFITNSDPEIGGLVRPDAFLPEIIGRGRAHLFILSKSFGIILQEFRHGEWQARRGRPLISEICTIYKRIAGVQLQNWSMRNISWPKSMIYIL